VDVVAAPVLGVVVAESEVLVVVESLLGLLDPQAASRAQSETVITNVPDIFNRRKEAGFALFFTVPVGRVLPRKENLICKGSEGGRQQVRQILEGQDSHGEHYRGGHDVGRPCVVPSAVQPHTQQNRDQKKDSPKNRRKNRARVS
jgi:hypothetical protein